eukprot:491188-Rhodomonas_salina.1
MREFRVVGQRSGCVCSGLWSGIGVVGVLGLCEPWARCTARPWVPRRSPGPDEPCNAEARDAHGFSRCCSRLGLASDGYGSRWLAALAGGVDYGFMSTSKKRSQALEYAFHDEEDTRMPIVCVIPRLIPPSTPPTPPLLEMARRDCVAALWRCAARRRVCRVPHGQNAARVAAAAAR